MSLMDAPYHEMQRVRRAGQVKNPGDNRHDPGDRQDDGQHPPAGRTARPACSMHLEPPAPPARCPGPRAAGSGPQTAAGTPGPLRWLTPQPGPARARATNRCTQRRLATMTTWAPSAAGSTAPLPAGPAACGNPPAPAARPPGSRRRRNVAASTPRHRRPARCRRGWRAPAVALGMAIPDTCAAPVREPASTIIEGARMRNEAESPASGPGPPASPGPFRRPVPALPTSRQAAGVPSPQSRGPVRLTIQPHPSFKRARRGGPRLNRMLWRDLALETGRHQTCA
jgi:hypothetical protein